MATERLSVASDMRIWWNWQTHRFEGLEVKTVQVRLLLSAPKTQTHKHISLCSSLIKNHLTFRIFLNPFLSKTSIHCVVCVTVGTPLVPLWNSERARRLGRAVIVGFHTGVSSEGG